LRNRFGFAIAAADVNGDKRDDLVVGRPGIRDGSGAEVVLGRKPDGKGRVLLACNVGPSGANGAYASDASRSGDPVVYGAAVAGIGDMDRDGCDEIALSITRANIPNNPPRAGLLLAFGYDASGARCGGHRTPFVLHIVADDHPLDGNIAGDPSTRLDDMLDLRGAPTATGHVLARGKGDVTGDGVPDLVFRAADLAVAGQRGAAVEIVSGSYLAGLCPGRLCREGRSGPFWSDGDWHVLGLRTLGPSQRGFLLSPRPVPRFASAIAVGDLSGDGVADIAVGSPDDSDAGPFAGQVAVYRGGASLIAAEPAPPWLTAVGDPAERSLFGSAVALGRTRGAGWLAVGAPASSRGGLGGGVGAAYLFRVEGGK
jgi:hypothetical protein